MQSIKRPAERAKDVAPLVVFMEPQKNLHISMKGIDMEKEGDGGSEVVQGGKVSVFGVLLVRIFPYSD